MNLGEDGEVAVDPVAAVEGWRAQASAAVDPVRFRVVEALARRAAAQQGEARRLMVRRVEALLAEQAAAQRTDAGSDTSLNAPAGHRVALTGLADLIDRLGAARRSDAPALVPLKSMAAFKGTWSRLRAEQRLRQALAQVPTRAGPMNSSHVMNQALQAMHALSPAYLDAFMAHVDTLLWLEQASGGGALGHRPAAPAEGRRRAGTRASRKA